MTKIHKPGPSDDHANKTPDSMMYDIVIIGGGVNGCGIARDAAGRGLSVLLCEKGDLAQGTSSTSTKLFHGGLRYLEYFKLRLVREALTEREILWQAMPHISWPMRFVLPYDPELRITKGDSTLGKLWQRVFPFWADQRPIWLLRAGLFVYDYLGGRKFLQPTRTLDLRDHKTGRPLAPRFQTGFEYSDCWVDDSRLVVLNARDAARRGATVLTRTAVTAVTRDKEAWSVEYTDTRSQTVAIVRSRIVINAAGPWVDAVLQDCFHSNRPRRVQLVKGSHLITRQLFEHDRAYIFRLQDNRVVFAIPYERDYTLIGTTDIRCDGDPALAECTPEEQDYLLAAVNRYIEKPVTADDIVARFSGVRPLYNDGASTATSATRDYVIDIDDQNGLPLLNIFGGKITTYRKLAEVVLDKLQTYFTELPESWTAGKPLPGGSFPRDGADELQLLLQRRYTFLSPAWANRLVRAYGTDAFELLGSAKSCQDLGQNFGADLTEREMVWLMDKEWAETIDDALWRRSKLGLRIPEDGQKALARWMEQRLGNTL